MQLTSHTFQKTGSGLVAILLLILTVMVTSGQAADLRNAEGMPGASSSFTHYVTEQNTSFNVSTIDHPLLNGNPNAYPMVTPSWRASTYSDFPYGVWYWAAQEKWTVFSQALTAMPENASFEVQVVSLGNNIFIHEATADNISAAATFIDSPHTNSNPNAFVFVTQLWTDENGIYNAASIGAWYEPDRQKWSIFNEDSSSMPESAQFIVHVLPSSDPYSFTHQATAANIVGNVSYIDNPLTNGNPAAILQVTKLWAPGGDSAFFDGENIGVWYSDTGWTIFNQDFINSLTENAWYQVRVVSVGEDDSELLVNGGFEVAGETKGIAQGWIGKNLKGDKRKCDKTNRPNSKPDKVFASSGECAFQLKGVAGSNSRIQQKDITVSFGNSLSLSAQISAKNYTNGASIIAKLNYTNGANDKIKLTLEPGTYNYTTLTSEPLLVAGTVEKTKVQVKMKNGSGKVYIDDLSLTQTPALFALPGDTLPALPDAPQSPDGFRN